MRRLHLRDGVAKLLGFADDRVGRDNDIRQRIRRLFQREVDGRPPADWFVDGFVAEQVVSFLKVNPKVEILLSGHTDNRGIVEHNLRLSQKRVERVKAYLVSNGISSRRIAGKGLGGSKPIAANDTEETRRLNRRVEFVIVKD